MESLKQKYIIRLDNLTKLVQDKFANNWRVFAEKIGKQQSYVSELKNGKRKFTEDLASDIEEILGLPHGFLDYALDENDDSLESGTFRIAEYNVKLAASSHDGAEVIAPENVKKYHTFDEEFLTDFHVKKENLAIVSVTGDSMEPTLHNGEKIVIDISKCEPLDNKVFAITTKNHCWVKRLRITPTGERWESDNDELRRYDAELNNGGTSVRIEGMVLYSLGRKIS